MKTEWASRCPASDTDVIDIRQVQEMSDFAPSKAIEREAQLKAELEKKK